MNIYRPTGKKVESWPQWVKRLYTELDRKNAEIERLKAMIDSLEQESFELKKRSCDLWSEVMETKASYEK
jgi:SMC interacting uncharacterized protein involved in chromosome segregation